MKKFMMLVFLFVFTSCSSKDLINLDTAKENVRSYYENGRYDNDMNEIIDGVIEELAGYNFDENSTAVFDVDETLLSNYQHTKQLGFGFKWDLWHEWMLQADADIIPQTKKLYDWLVARDVNIVILTGRSSDVYEETLKNLKNAGITVFDTLITRSALTGKMSAFVYKQRERKLLADKGYKIIACVGDQRSDVEGEFTGLKVKLPNYLYLIE